MSLSRPMSRHEIDNLLIINQEYIFELQYLYQDFIRLLIYRSWAATIANEESDPYVDNDRRLAASTTASSVNYD
jgi:hypothetical protein